MIEIRKLRKAEFMDFVELVHRIFPDRANPNLLLDLYEIFPDGFIVALDKNKMIGFAIGIVSSDGKGKIVLIGVENNYRRRGIGTRLLRRLFLVLSMKGVNEIELEVRVSNTKAISFYKKNGFRISELRKNYYEDGEDGYIMMRTISFF